jgi:hypothetical protein
MNSIQKYLLITALCLIGISLFLLVLENRYEYFQVTKGNRIVYYRQNKFNGLVEWADNEGMLCTGKRFHMPQNDENKN